ncbi:MAG: TraB/GumN family protein, partial [Pseudohongiellaceae bacterium]
MLWEVTPESGTTSYLFGTIHSEDPRVVELPEPVQETFDQAKIFCAEMKLDAATRLRMSQSMLYLNGERLNRKIDPELYEKTVSLISQYGIPKQMVPMFKPWA